MKREVDLTPYVQPILDAAEKTSERDYLMLAVCCQAGFRRGEVTGNKDRREVWPVDMFEKAKKKSDIPTRQRILSYLQDHPEASVEAEDGIYSLIRNGTCVLKMRNQDPLPGLQREDLREGAIWVKGKGGTEYAQPLPPNLYQRLKKFAGAAETGPIFDFSADGLYKISHKYAKMVGCPDWKLAHPHRLRHAYCQTLRRNKVPLEDRQVLMRHKGVDMTRHYDGDLSIDEKRAAIQGIWK